MKKLFQTAAMTMVVASLQAQSDVVVINGHVNGDTKGFNKIYYYTAGVPKDSAIIENGKFSIRVPFSKTFAQLFFTEYEVRGQNHGYRPFPLLLDKPATIDITMDIEKGFYSSQIEGAPTAVLFNEFLKKQNEAFAKVSNEMQNLYPGYRSKAVHASRHEDGPDKFAISRDSLMKIYLAGAIKDFVKAHPNDFVSAYVLEGSAKSSMTLAQMQEAYDYLTPKMQQSESGKNVAAYIKGSQNALIGKQAANFVLTDAAGNSISLGQLKGKYVWIDFWASWCGPCKAAFPKMRDIYEKYKGKNFEIVGVSTDKTKEPWLNALNQLKNPWLQVWDDKTVASEFAVAAFPTGYLIDPDGKIITKEVGFDPNSADGIAKKLEEIFSK